MSSKTNKGRNKGNSDDASRLYKGQVVQATISSIAAGGDGVSRDHGMPIFVSRVATGDVATIELFDVRKDFARGRLVELIQPSPQRSEPPCKLFKVCGGCQFQHLSYDAQLVVKQDIVCQAIKHLGKLDPQLVKAVIPARQTLFYRNKVQFPVANPKNSTRILAGYYKQDSHDLVNIKHCPVQPEPLDRMLNAVKELCEEQGLHAYDETTGRGWLRHITARYSFDRAQILVTLVINKDPESTDLEGLRPLGLKIMEAVPEIIGVCVNFNSAPGNKIFGESNQCLAGSATIVEVLRSKREDRSQRLRDGLSFELSPVSFFQVNTEQTVELLDLVADFVLDGSLKSPLIVDAYAGVGTIAFWLADIACRVIAIEEFSKAVADGVANCALNQISNVDFRSDKVEVAAAQLLKEGIKPDVVVLDPPRKGLSPQALENVIALGAERIIYVSCNPATLARDLQILERNGYKTKEIQPIDMFPQTYHVESVTRLDLVKPPGEQG